MGDVLNWLRILHDSQEIVELRSIEPKPVISGYFRVDSPSIEKELARYPDRTFYQTMNQVDEACYSRGQHEHLVAYPKETTSDNDIIGYQWVLVDADPVRKSGISAADAEKEAARQVSRRVWKCLKQRGFHDPIIADSGNGFHLLYKVHTPLEEKPTIEQFLKTLDMWFSTEQVKIDTAVFNAARITKLYGTMARKGANTQERPHRMSKVLHAPSRMELTPWALFQQIAGEYAPATGSMATTNQFSRFAQADAGFNLEQYLSSHQISVTSKTGGAGYTKFVLKECPFNADHKAPDAAVFQFSNGSLGFKCFHNSCSDHGWREFRQKIDPAAYETSPSAQASYTNFPQNLQSTAANTVQGTPPGTNQNSQSPEGTAASLPVMLNLTDIESYDRSKVTTIKSRFPSFDRLIGGFNKGELSIWSGGNASGKSTLVSQLGLEAVHQGCKVVIFSGEMHRSRVKNWLYMQAAGRDNVEVDPQAPLSFRLKAGVKEHLDNILNGKVFVYNNDYGNSWDNVVNALCSWADAQKADVIIIDNLMALDFSHTSDKLDMQTTIVKSLAQIAKKINVHIHFICHPRKTDAFLRKNDISGTADITNAADNVFMVHRANSDFRSRVKEVYPRLQIPADVGNAVEIMKNRDLGVTDEMILLYFDKSCKTMSDIKGGIPMYSWSDGFIPVDASQDPDFPF